MLACLPSDNAATEKYFYPSSLHMKPLTKKNNVFLTLFDMEKDQGLRSAGEDLQPYC